MHQGRRPRRGLAVASALLALIVGFALTACGGAADAGSTKKVTIGLGYVPNIQFAPFYVADALGYYKDAGVEVTFRHHTLGEDLFGAIVSGQEDLIFAAGDEMLQARAKDIPLVYVAQVFNQYPVALMVPESSDIQSVADLKGHTIGIPGAYGATYTGLLALLKSAGLTEADVDIQSIGFTQVPALLAGHVDAVMGYINNEAIQFEKSDFPVRTFPVSEVQPLISNGICVLQEELDKDPDVVKAVVEATLRGAAYVVENPEETVDLSKEYVPGLDDPENSADALDVLRATLPIFETSGTPGHNDPAAWESMQDFMIAEGLLEKPSDLNAAMTNEYLP